MIKLLRSSSRVAASTDVEDAHSTSAASLEYSRDENESAFDAHKDEVDDTQSYEDLCNDEAILECINDTVSDESTGRGSLDSEQRYVHDLHEGDHIVRWTMLAYCYPVQVHGIVLSVGPELVTIVDCGLTSVKRADKVGTYDEDGKINSSYTKGHRRMNIFTLVDKKEIKRWRKVQYGEECEVRVHSTSSQTHLDEKDEPPSAEEHSVSEHPYLEDSQLSAQIGPTQSDNNDALGNNQSSSKQEKLSSKRKSSFWPFCSSKSAGTAQLDDPNQTPSQHDTTNKETQLKNGESLVQKSETTLRLPESDPPALVLARLRFLLEYGEGDKTHNKTTQNTNARSPLLPPHHILYANSECIAVWIKTGHWSTLQASVFLHSSTVGNAKQTATLAMYLSAQTVTVPAAGIWGFFGGTTTISLFSAQPWLVPAIVCGGIVYVGLPTIVLWRAKSQWANTEKTLNAAFWESVEPSVIVKLIQTWSGLEG